jgi:hypothetical protein
LSELPLLYLACLIKIKLKYRKALKRKKHLPFPLLVRRGTLKLRTVLIPLLIRRGRGAVKRFY